MGQTDAVQVRLNALLLLLLYSLQKTDPLPSFDLFSKHGCDYKGYGLASRLPRLDLSGYRNELLQDRQRPVIQEFCSICQERGVPRKSRRLSDDHDLVTCDGGCSRAFHLQCFSIDKENESYWYCSASCLENRKKQRVGKCFLHRYCVSY